MLIFTFCSFHILFLLLISVTRQSIQNIRYQTKKNNNKKKKNKKLINAKRMNRSNNAMHSRDAYAQPFREINITFKFGYTIYYIFCSIKKKNTKRIRMEQKR